MIPESLIQKPVISLREYSTLKKAAQLMRDSHVGDIVIIGMRNGHEVPIGILTDRDIVVSTIALGIDPLDLQVDDIMSPAVVVAGPEDGISHIITLMKEHGIKRVPIVNAEGSLRGIVSSNDLLSLLSQEMDDVTAIPAQQRRVEARMRKKFA